MMMDCRHTIEHLPWYLNGSLDAADSERIAAHLAGCERCRHELEQTRASLQIFDQHLSIEVLSDLAAGRELTIDSEVLEAHLAACETCGEELSMLREGRRALAIVDVESAQQDPRPRLVPAAGGKPSQSPERENSQPKERRWRALAMAASLAAAMAGGIAFDARRSANTLEEHLAALGTTSKNPVQPNVALIDLFPNELSVREGETSAPAQVPQAQSPSVLILNSQIAELTGPLRLVIANDAGQTVVELEGLVPSSDAILTVSLVTAGLPSGKLTLSIWAPAPRDQTPLETYSLQVR